MAAYYGDISYGTVLDIKFNTHDATGAPLTLAGSPLVKCYKGNSATTEITTGVVLTVDLDGMIGLHNVRVSTASDPTFYAAGSDFQLVLTAGTVSGLSIAGTVLGSFSIDSRSALRPATPGRTLVVDSAGLADATAVKLGPTGAGTAQTARDLGLSIPAAAPGAAGGLFIAGTNAATSITTGLTSNIIGNVTGNLVGVVTTVTNLTNAPTVGDLTTAMRASVNAEVDTSLSDIFLNRLFAADYDPDNKPGVSTALLNELIGSNAGVSRYSAAALALSPTGGSAPTVGEIATAVWHASSVGDFNQTNSIGKSLYGAFTLNTSNFTVATLAAAPGGAGSSPETIATAVWRDLLSSSDMSLTGSIGKLIKDNIDVAISSRTKPADTQAAVTSVTNDVGITQAAADKAWNTAVRAVTSVTSDVSITQAAADKVWNTTVRTITSFAGDVSITQAAADKVWVSAARTLTSLPGDVGITQAAADKVWVSAARTLTSGLNITLSKGTGVIGFNDISSSGVAGAVWNSTTASHAAAGTFGLAVTSPQAASADPWATVLPGSYTAGSAGHFLGNYVPLAVRLLQADREVDVAHTPWQLVTIDKDTNIQLLRQNMYDSAGGMITTATGIVGRLISP